MEYLQVKTPFIEKWEKEMEDLLAGDGKGDGSLFNAWEKDLQEELSGHLNVPPPSYADFIKDGLKDASLVGAFSLPLKAQAFEKSLDPTPLMEKVAAMKPNLKRKPEEVPEANDTNRKELHNATEKRRREKINTKIHELRDIIPAAKSFGGNKATVLQSTVEHIKSLNTTYSSLLQTNRQLQETNAQLLNDLREVHRLLWARARDQQQINAATTAAAVAAVAGVPPLVPPSPLSSSLPADTFSGLMSP